MVREFNETLGRGRYGCNDNGPSAPTSEEKVLGARMLLEEVFEYMDAAGIEINIDTGNGKGGRHVSTDIKNYRFHDVGEADLPECADALGDIEYITAGIENCYDFGMEEVHDEIHRSNMTKEPRDSGPLGKVIKGPTYSPPNLDSVLKNQVTLSPEDLKLVQSIRLISALSAVDADEGEG